MGTKRSPGLRKKGKIWQIEKQIKGYGILRESTGTDKLEEAERYLAKRLEEIRQAVVYGVRPDRTFREAAAKYLVDQQDMRSIRVAATHLKLLDPWIGKMPLDKIHDGTLAPFVKARKAEGKKSKTINLSLAYVSRILNLAARKWRDEMGLTWLHVPPMISLLLQTDARLPYPLSWREQRLLFEELAPHLQDMALFKVNTGCRDQEVCNLRWDWEVRIPELERSIFVVPGALVKNGEDRLVVLNHVAQAVVDSRRGKHSVYVFTYEGRKLQHMLNFGWRNACFRAAKRYPEVFGEPAPEGFRRFRVHDLKHTFGRRLRAAGVPLETRKVLLGHKNGDITTHYSAPEIAELLEAANRICESETGKNPELTLIRPKNAF